MKRVSRNLGKKFSEGRLRRHRAAIARAIANGSRFGSPVDPETHYEERVCRLPACAKTFTIKITKGFSPKVRAGFYCSHPHALQHTAMRRRKCPADYDLLYDLYVVKRLSTEEIAAMFGTTHKSVQSRMKEVGIERRRVGHSRRTVCDAPGCGKPVFKIKHPQNGSVYGTKCETHYWEHRKSLYASRYNRIKEARGNIPERVLQLVVNGVSTSDQIAKRLNLPIKVVSTTMGRLHRSGKVEPFGTVMIRRAKASLWRAVRDVVREAA